MAQPTKVKIVGTFHVRSTGNRCPFTPADGTTERGCYFCRFCAKNIPKIWQTAIESIVALALN